MSSILGHLRKAHASGFHLSRMSLLVPEGESLVSCLEEEGYLSVHW